MNRVNNTKPIRELAYKIREKILEKVFAYVKDDFIWSSQGLSKVTNLLKDFQCVQFFESTLIKYEFDESLPKSFLNNLIEILHEYDGSPTHTRRGS